MPGNTPTRDLSINDIVYNVGELAGKVEGMGQEIGRLRGAIEKIHCPKESEINAMGGACVSNTADIVDIKKKMAATENFAKGGLFAGRMFAVTIIWLVMTGIPGVVYAYKVMKEPIKAQTPQTPQTPQATQAQPQVTP
jgi:hypothetical protein